MAIFHQTRSDTSSSNHICPMPSNLATSPDADFISGLTFRTFNTILSGSCTAFTILIIFVLMALHATHLSRPVEQLKIMKICLLIPLYSGISLLTIAFPNTFVYLYPWLDFFQSIALASFFLLLCEFISPSDEGREMFFAPLLIKSQRKGADPRDGLTWYRRKWIFIFQYPVVSFLVAVMTDITQAANVYCLESSHVYFAHLWLNIIINVSLTLAVWAVFKFYTQLKDHLRHHKPLAKLLAFKLIVGLTFAEEIAFWILRSTHVLQPGPTLTYADINMGVQTMIVCIQMIFFALFFHYAYDVKPYLLSNARPLPSLDAGSSHQGSHFEYPSNGLSYQGGILGIRAWTGMLSPMEVLRGIAFAFSMARKMRHGDVQLQPTDPAVVVKPSRAA